MRTSRSSEARGRGLLVVVALLGACRGEPQQQAPAPAATEPTGPNAPTKPAIAAPSPPSPVEGMKARLTRLEGDVTAIGGTTLAAPAELSPLSGLKLAEGARVVLDLSSQAQAVVDGPGQLYLGGDRPAQLLLLEGSLHLSRAPGGRVRDPAPRVATADASVELAGSGELLVATDWRRGTYVAALAGSASLATGEASEAGELRSLALRAGQQATVAGDAWPEASDGPADLAAARKAGADAIAELSRAPAAAERAEAAAGRFDALASKLSAIRAEGRALVERQRQSAATKARTAAQALQGDVVANARALLRLRSTLAVGWERLQVRSLAARPWTGPTQGREAPFGPYAGLARSLLGAPDSRAVRP